MTERSIQDIQRRRDVLKTARSIISFGILSTCLGLSINEIYKMQKTFWAQDPQKIKKHFLDQFIQCEADCTKIRFTSNMSQIEYINYIVRDIKKSTLPENIKIEIYYEADSIMLRIMKKALTDGDSNRNDSNIVNKKYLNNPDRISEILR
jgi:hypothetical protein